MKITSKMAASDFSARQGGTYSLILVLISPANSGNSEIQMKPEFCIQTYT